MIAFGSDNFKITAFVVLKCGGYKICSPSLRNLNVWVTCCCEDFIICNIGEVIRYCCWLTIWLYILGVMVCCLIYYFYWREARNGSLEISEVF